MKIVNKIDQLREKIRSHKNRGEKVGFVPTMGALHKGHLSLMRKAVSENDFTVVSIFVNPIQFGEGEDFEAYPRDIEKDAERVRETGADLIFAPVVDEIIGKILLAYVDIKDLSNNLCGLSRPGHFRGVCTIVSKLFNIVMPDRAYFGKKDIQQLMIIKKMVKDLNFDIDITPCDIIRENDGLAMSSRNAYLSADERQEAVVLSRSLKDAGQLIDRGEKSSKVVIGHIEKLILQMPGAKIDYIRIVNENMQDIEEIRDGVIIALAVFIGKTRLIDNYIVGDKICY